MKRISYWAKENPIKVRIILFKNIFTVVFSICTLTSKAQIENKIFERVQGIKNAEITWFNIDGYSIAYRQTKVKYDEKGLKKAFKLNKIDEKTLKKIDSSLIFNHQIVSTEEKRTENVIQKNTFYFLETKQKTINVIWFATTNDTDKSLEIDIVKLIMDNNIPQSNYVEMRIDSINFGGRKIGLGNNCYWTFLNAVQCPNYGEINWSIHQSIKTAQQSVLHQELITKSKKSGKVLSEEFIDVFFEDIETKAKKIVFDLNGVSTIATGGKSLIIYYVVAKVRGNYISCVMSHWDNDAIGESGLPPLLDKIMKLKSH